ncbi:MAG: PAS domain S-box protein [Xanthobacteraceae bacterium]|jgi:PAS domain S-box-containing protein
MSGDGIELHSELELPHFLLKAGEAITRGDHYFRDVLEALPAAIYTTDAAGRITYYNQAAALLWGQRPELGESEWCGSWKLYWPDGRPLPHDQCPMALAIKEGRPNRGMEAVAERPDGIKIPFIPYPTPLYDSSGTLVGAVNMLVDITDRKRAEESALRLASIVEFSDDAIVSKDLNGVITSWNRGAQALFGYTAREAVGNSVRTLIPPDRQDEESEILARIRRGEHIEHYETVRRRKDGTLIDISLTVSPVKNAAGEIVGASKIARNISERKRAEEALHLIVDESKHRIRNTLATVQAIATQTLHASDEERLAFVARLSALGRAHDLLSVENWSRAKIGDVVNQALAPFRDKAYERFVVEGPEDLWTSSNHASLLTMALHELATNASKYGALANNSGQVRLSWELVSQDQESRLRLCWTESGGPPVTAPSHAGFGSFLMNRVLKAERGEVRLEYKPQGLVATFELTS